MHQENRMPCLLAVLALAALFNSSTLEAATPSAEQALQLSPIQDGVDYDRPPAAEIKNCTIRAEKEGSHTGWVVRDPQGQVLRRFSDTNDDNVVDQWSYYKDGLEAYRDIDSNYNGKADQYRWFHLGGARWGNDRNEDGIVDSWELISAEEVAAEVVAALKSRDAARFSRLLLTASELKTLGAGPAQTAELEKKIKAAPETFRTLASRQKIVTSASAFVSFGATRPGIVPVGLGGATKDLLVYENVVAMVQTAGKHEQIHIGTLVRVGDLWRLIDAPHVEPGDDVASGYFFQTPHARRPGTPQEQVGGPSEKVRQMMAELEKLDHDISNATPKQQAELNAKRADLLEQLADQASEAEQRSLWIRQLADTVSAAVQIGGYPEGVRRLISLEEKLASKDTDKPLLAYVKFRRLAAAYGQDLQAPKADFPKIQAQWITDMEAFVKAHSDSPDAAEAMLQLAIAQEFAGEDEEAKKWYGKIVSEFPASVPAKKAAGAKTRLESVGRVIRLEGPTMGGKTVDLAQYRGKTVLIQYWATWCEPCMAEMARLKELLAKHTGDGFAILGVNLNDDRKDVASFLEKEPLPWPQIYEPGGLESRLANEMGILTLPTMVLIDKTGRVISRNIHVTELDSELKKLR